MIRFPSPDDDLSIKSLLEHSDEVIRKADEIIDKSSKVSASVMSAIRQSDKFLIPALNRKNQEASTKKRGDSGNESA